MIVLKQVIIIALLILIGIICFKIKIINKDSTKTLSSLVLLVVNPAVILVSYQIPFDEQLLKGLLWAGLFSVISTVIGIILAQLFIRKKGSRLPIERFSAIYSNCGFMGIPLVNSIYGPEGVFYLTAYITVFNILVWTHGVFIMNEKFDRKMIAEAVKSPAIIATVAGLLLFIFSISIPETPFTVIKYLAELNTPLAMITAGATIAQTNLLNALKNPRAYLVCTVKLIIIPIVSYFALFMLNVNPIVIGTVILASACPAAATGTLFAIRFKKDSLYSSELFAICTMLSIVTLPALMTVIQKFISFFS